MKIVRQRSPERYTAIDNEVIEDARISFRALGVLSYLLSRPDGWETDSERLSASEAREGRDAVRTALRELETVGYLARRKMQDLTTGRWSTVTAIIDRPTPGNPSSGPRRLENRPSVDRTSVSQALSQITDSNHGDKPVVVTECDQPSSRTPHLARAAEDEIPPEVLDLLGDIHELASELRVRRQAEGHPAARWSTRAVRRAIAAALTAGYAAEHIAPALLSIALDPATKTPGRLPHDGPWWEANELARCNAEREASAHERQRADAAARRAAELVEDARMRADCWRCRSTGRTVMHVDGRNFTAICTHGIEVAG